MPKQKHFYIASGLGNAEQVKQVAERLKAFGWIHTYDWTVHGSVQSAGADRIAEVAAAESEGVWMADVLIVLLPGGRGTHTELGIGIGMVDPIVFAKDEDRMRIAIYSPDPAKDFSPTGGTTCAFYFHPCVERFDNLDAMIDILTSVN